MANRLPYNRIKPPCGSSINRSHALSNGLVACWLFNENGGTKINDISGRNNNGTLTNGPVWNNYALSFDGTDDYIDCGNSPLLAFTTPFTVSFFAKASSTPAQYDGLIGFNDTSGSWSIGWGFYWNSGSQMRFFAGSYSIGGTNESVTTPGIWHQYTGVYNGSKVFLYIDGINTTNTTTVATAGDDILRIGELRTFGGAHSYNFNGEMFGVRLYNRALTYNEIIELYRNPFGNLLAPTRKKFIYQQQTSSFIYNLCLMGTS